MTKASPIPEDVILLIEACHSHATDLLDAAKIILSNKHPHIAYHLAVLSLEELGKSEWIFMNHLASERSGEEVSFKSNYDDHVKKIFLALWGPSLGKEVITKDQIEMHQGLARKVHDNRLKGLYVSTDKGGLIDPKKAVTKKEVENIISLTEARIELSKIPNKKSFSDEERKDFEFYLEATEDPEQRKLILGKKSMEKLAELGASAWMRWMREEFEEAERESQKVAERELRRSKPTDEERFNEKWKVKIRIYSDSHSIRRKALKWWNDLCGWIKLEAVNNKKKEMLIEISLPRVVPVQDLWNVAYEKSIDFLIALNIGTFGLFWWQLPKDICRFYESITDLDDPNGEVRIERSPSLKIDWGKTALSEGDMRQVFLCFSALCMLKRSNKRMEIPLAAYLTGLKLFGKNDIHLQFEPNIYEQFYIALKEGMRAFGDWDGNPESYEKSFKKFVETLSTEADEWRQYFSLGEALNPSDPKPLPITLKEAGTMKMLCDAYFVKAFQKVINEPRKEDDTKQKKDEKKNGKK